MLILINARVTIEKSFLLIQPAFKLLFDAERLECENLPYKGGGPLIGYVKRYKVHDGGNLIPMLDRAKKMLA